MSYKVIKLSNDKKIELNPLTTKAVEVSTDGTVDIIRRGEDIIEIDFTTYSLKIGDTIEFENIGKFTIDKILLGDTKRKFTLLAQTYTFTSQFILPIFSNSRKDLFWFNDTESAFVNAYLRTRKPITGHKHQEGLIYLKYRFLNNPDFIEFEGQIRKRKDFVCAIDPDDEHVIYVLKVPEDRMKILDLFKKGLYSQFPEYHKRRILKFHDYQIGGKMYQVLNKDKKLLQDLEKKLGMKLPTDSELMSKPGNNEEV